MFGMSFQDVHETAAGALWNLAFNSGNAWRIVEEVPLYTCALPRGQRWLVSWLLLLLRICLMEGTNMIAL